MSPTLQSNLRTSLATAIRDALDGGTGAGYIEIWTAAFAAQLSEHALSDPSSVSIVAGVYTLDSIADDTILATGTAAVCRFYDGDDVLWFEGTVAVSGGDINFNSIAFTQDATASINDAGTITVPET